MGRKLRESLLTFGNLSVGLSWEYSTQNGHEDSCFCYRTCCSVHPISLIQYLFQLVLLETKKLNYNFVFY